MKLAYLYSIFMPPMVIANQITINHHDTVANDILGIHAQYSDYVSEQELSLLYDDVIPDMYKKDKMLNYAFGRELQGGCGLCPCLCYYCPENSGTCCLPKVAEDKHCRSCDYPSGECNKCDQGFTLNPNNICQKNKKCTDVIFGYADGAGFCNKCESDYSINNVTLMCNRNNQCNHVKHGICESCNKGYHLNAMALCVKNKKFKPG